MSKKLVKCVVGASVLAAGLGMVGSASAQLLGSATFPPQTFAIELNYNSTATPAGTALTPAPITTNLGFGVSAGQNRYIRYILSGGKFHTALAGSALLDTTTAVAPGSGFGGNLNNTDGTTVVSGGGVGDSCVVFQITGLTGTGNGQGDVIKFTSSALDVASNAAPVTATYTLHETATSATCASGTNAAILASPVSGPIATFSNSIALTSTSYTDTADVQYSLPPILPFGGFVASTVAPSNTQSTTLADLADLSLAVATYTGLVPPQPTKADGVTAITFADLFTKAVLTVGSADGGSFAASSLNNGATPPVLTVDLYTNNTVSIVKYAGNGNVNTAGTSASWTFNAPVSPVTGSVGYFVTGKTALPVGTYTASVALTPVTNVTLETVPAVASGSIIHNGTVLQAPWFTTYSGYISRFFLTNTGAFDAPYTSSFLTESGVTSAAGAGASGVVKAGTTLEIDASSLVTLTGGTRGTVVFSVAGPNQAIQGAYNVVNAATGSITVSPMIRPGTN